MSKPSPAPLQLALLPPDRLAEQLRAGRADAVLVSLAGDARRDSAVLQPPLLRWGVEVIGLGQRWLVLLHHPAYLGRAKPKAQDEAPCEQPLCGQPRCGEPPGCRQPMGYLLPPRQQIPLLHRTLEREGRLPVHGCAEPDHRGWLQQLTSQPLLLPADLTLLTLPSWGEAGLAVRQPLRPLTESLWLLLCRGEAERPQLARMIQWWGGPQLRRPRQRERPWARR